MNSNSARPPRLHALDGLRGVAAVVVVVSHSANAGLLPIVLGRGFGQMGVALFYALSAFLLGHLYLNTDFNKNTVWKYGVSRVSRVFPLFYAVIAVILIAFLFFEQAWAVVLTGYGVDSLDDLIRNAALVKGTSVLWSIPVEIHYYAVFILFWWLRSRFKAPIWALVILGVSLQLGAIHAMASLPGRNFTTLPFWGHMFLFGLVLSQIRRVQLTSRFAWAQSVALLALCALALPELRRTLGLPTYFNFADPLTAGTPLLLLYLACNHASPLRWLSHSVPRWLGQISFSLYLIHMPILTLVSTAGWLSAWPILGFGVVMATSLLLAWGLNRLLEVPCQSFLRRHFNPRRANRGGDRTMLQG
jgi:peptidoglycan/LPS O-acetylase OafA/YrhL